MYNSVSPTWTTHHDKEKFIYSNLYEKFLSHIRQYLDAAKVTAVNAETNVARALANSSDYASHNNEESKAFCPRGRFNDESVLQVTGGTQAASQC